MSWYNIWYEVWNSAYFQVIRRLDTTGLTQVKKAVVSGGAVLVTGAAFSAQQELDSLLAMRLRSEAGMRIVDVGEQEVQFHDEFRYARELLHGT